MRKSYGYDSYRGRSRMRTALTVVIVFLLVVLLLAVVAFLYLQRYMVYTDDGQVRVELPFFRQEETETTPTYAPTEPPVVVETPTPTLEPTPEPTPEPLPAVYPVSLYRASLTDGSAQRTVENAGGNAALFNMKDGNGTLGYVSQVELAVKAGASESKAGLNDAILTLNQGELYTIARVACFKDNKAPRQDTSLAIKTNSGYNWKDGGEIRWTNPSIPEARQYVTDICVELAALGFDEILLDDARFPTTGQLENIKVGEAYDEARLTEWLETFYREVRAALADSGVKLSIAVDAAALEGTETLSGQTAALVGKYADRIYILGAAEEGACDSALSAAGYPGKAVVYVTGNGEDLPTTGKRLTAAKSTD